MCHGAIESLKATPINKNTRPIISDGEIVEIWIFINSKDPVDPYKYTKPKRKIPVEKEAKIKYLKEASKLNFPLPKAINAIIGKEASSNDK